MDRPLVSVVIPCFRQAHYLPAAVDSVLGQSYPAVEVIVVNDGSDDRTEEVARGYGERVKYLYKTNGGQASARNAGLTAAGGKYVLFLDADDLLHPDAVGWLVEGAAGRDDVLCTMGIEYFEREGQPGKRRLPPNHPNLTALLLTDNFVGPPCGFLAPRAAVAVCGGFEPRLQGTEDWDLWARLVFAGCKVVAVPRVGAYYRVHPGSWSRNRGRMARQYVAYHARVLRRLQTDPGSAASPGCDPDELTRTVRRQLAEAMASLAYHRREEGHYWAALAGYLASLRRGRLGAVGGICKLLPHRLLRAVRAAG